MSRIVRSHPMRRRIRSAGIALFALACVPALAPRAPAQDRSGPAAPPAGAQQPDTNTVYKFILDYDVPESPAFAALGVTPANVLRGGAAKPIVVNTLTDALESGKLNGGLALDFSPMVFLKPTFTSFDEYRESLSGKLLRQLLFSLATVQSQEDTSALRIGVGARVTLIDENDPLSNPDLFNQVNTLLQQAAPAAPRPGQSTGVGAPVTVSNKEAIADAYRRAREEARNRPGLAVSAGWGFAGLLRGSVVTADSLGETAHNVWISGRYKLRGPASFLLTSQWRQIPGDDADDLRTGLALRAEFEGVSTAAELVYDSFTGSLHPGGNAELRVLPGTRIVLGIASDPPRTAADKQPRLRMRTQVKWNFAELLRR